MRLGGDVDAPGVVGHCRLVRKACKLADRLEDDAFNQWSGIQAKVLNAEQAIAASSVLLDMLPTLMSGLTVAVMLGVGGLRVIDGALTLGSLVAFQALMASFSEPIMNLVNQASSLQLVKGALERLEDIYNYPLDGPADADSALERFPAKLTGRIELKDIRFGYSILEAPLIADLSINIRPGARIALVGASGSGKSTLGRLICGLYKPWSGEILIDGARLSEIPAQVRASPHAHTRYEKTPAASRQLGLLPRQAISCSRTHG